MSDDERCSPIIVNPANSSTAPTASSTSVFPFLFQDEVTTAAADSLEYHSAAHSSTEKLIEEALYRVVIVVVCGVGLICNIINLIVLSRKSLTATMERLERSAHYGLVGKQALLRFQHFKQYRLEWIIYLI